MLRLIRQELGEPGALNEVAPAIAPQKEREVLVMLEVLRFQRKRQAGIPAILGSSSNFDA